MSKADDHVQISNNGVPSLENRCVSRCPPKSMSCCTLKRHESRTCDADNLSDQLTLFRLIGPRDLSVIRGEIGELSRREVAAVLQGCKVDVFLLVGDTLLILWVGKSKRFVRETSMALTFFEIRKQYP